MLARVMILILALWCGWGAASAEEPPARGMPFEVYIRLEYGMTEGEVVLRAGRPDHQSMDNIYEGLKSLYYFPTATSPFMTTISLRSGRVVNIERVRKSF